IILITNTQHLNGEYRNFLGLIPEFISFEREELAAYQGMELHTFSTFGADGAIIYRRQLSEASTPEQVVAFMQRIEALASTDVESLTFQLLGEVIDVEVEGGAEELAELIANLRGITSADEIADLIEQIEAADGEIPSQMMDDLQAAAFANMLEANGLFMLSKPVLDANGNPVTGAFNVSAQHIATSFDEDTGEYTYDSYVLYEGEKQVQYNDVGIVLNGMSAHYTATFDPVTGEHTIQAFVGVIPQFVGEGTGEFLGQKLYSFTFFGEGGAITRYRHEFKNQAEINQFFRTVNGLNGNKESVEALASELGLSIVDGKIKDDTGILKMLGISDQDDLAALNAQVGELGVVAVLSSLIAAYLFQNYGAFSIENNPAGSGNNSHTIAANYLEQDGETYSGFVLYGGENKAQYVGGFLVNGISVRYTGSVNRTTGKFTTNSDFIGYMANPDILIDPSSENETYSFNIFGKDGQIDYDASRAMSQGVSLLVSCIHATPEEMPGLINRLQELWDSSPEFREFFIENIASFDPRFADYFVEDTTPPETTTGPTSPQGDLIPDELDFPYEDLYGDYWGGRGDGSYPGSYPGSYGDTAPRSTSSPSASEAPSQRYNVDWQSLLNDLSGDTEMRKSFAGFIAAYAGNSGLMFITVDKRDNVIAQNVVQDRVINDEGAVQDTWTPMILFDGYSIIYEAGQPINAVTGMFVFEDGLYVRGQVNVPDQIYTSANGEFTYVTFRTYSGENFGVLTTVDLEKVEAVFSRLQELHNQDISTVDALKMLIDEGFMGEVLRLSLGDGFIEGNSVLMLFVAFIKQLYGSRQATEFMQSIIIDNWDFLLEQGVIDIRTSVRYPEVNNRYGARWEEEYYGGEANVSLNYYYKLSGGRSVLLGSRELGTVPAGMLYDRSQDDDLSMFFGRDAVRFDFETDFTWNSQLEYEDYLLIIEDFAARTDEESGTSFATLFFDSLSENSYMDAFIETFTTADLERQIIAQMIAGSQSFTSTGDADSIAPMGQFIIRNNKTGKVVAQNMFEG
ncbi:hypothetical protein ACFL3D_06805, partial [Candidatus Omnitrophota bacterium]